MSLKVLILGINGFIGSSLLEQALATKNDWHFIGLDLGDNKITDFLDNPRLQFKRGDINQETAWIEQQVQACDVVLPLVAIATPATYVNNPLAVFELDFEANLRIIRLCVKHKKRVVFPSTSEVYGMCTDEEFDEQTSNFVLGPINKPRWIYSCSKQMLDRVIHAYGLQDKLSYTLFRPFNWMGAKLDDPHNPKPGSSRVVSQFMGNILRGEAIQLVNGGQQRRTFIDIEDGIEALIKIIANENEAASQRIFNIGNPKNDISIRELAELLIEQVKSYPKYADAAKNTQLQTVAADNYYGKGYQDVDRRVPSIKNAQNYLGWQPKTDIKTSVKKILDYYLSE
ncbi:bifunctional UDP-4-keto-pentose/UDP-xylose synthase [Rickettsiella endosymbiont of Dermanyssus gallinae]|uniref:bifunctional UDP-4-keto-pentose/UDP-xylose synthase n=1 Tax=Rickettsiella endosymbiont of Dermanyssus gallinae TaxID=2856608 RepID=UPI001C52C5A7|nr:bifunctional UDP-4-keto-pentose/UDP-xylose synthase [Rickettsiella endosymbiont of Dermanyssus gallinae]